METWELRPAVTALFSRARRRSVRVAVEQEYVVGASDGAVVPIGEVRRAAAASPAMPYLSFEPGGQLELSLPPARDPLRDLAVLTADLRRRLTGMTLRAIPVDPRLDVPLQLTSPRYLAMQRHFDRIGPAGRRMMRRTASTQICLDWWPGRAGLEQWRVLNLAAPFVAARFNHSERLATWLEVDPARTAFDARLLRGDDPIEAYAAFAAGATVFVDGPAGHLTTLFPPVRPRGTYLEVRFLDALPPDEAERAVAMLSDLMYDDVRRRDVLRRIPCTEGLWRAAADGVLDQDEVAAA
ncbi:glutamate-cysteine ligase family protein [Kribbella sp. NPDC048915]|uniref:glutamate-cysteine ligase family protein n=1 Tax=Kribbella sp. NPDC048915 TaxID=3155148 RepID=UPI0034033B29